MAGSFTLLDHLAPYLSPCLPFCGSSRRITLVASPQLRPRAHHDDILDVDDGDEADLYSLHSGIGRASSSHHLAGGGESAAMTLSRWQLLRSWWRTPDARWHGGKGSRDGRLRQGEIFLEMELDEDADELALAAPSIPALRQPRQPSRQSVPRMDTGASNRRPRDAFNGMEQSASRMQTGTQESKRARQAPERRHSRTSRSRPSGSQRSRSARSDASSAASTLESYSSVCSPPLSPPTSGIAPPPGESCDIGTRKERRSRKKRSSRRPSHAETRSNGTGYGGEDQYEDETGYSQSTAPTSVSAGMLEEDFGAPDLADGKSGGA